MYIWFVNFAYRHDLVDQSLEVAISALIAVGFEATLHQADGSLVASYHPVTGLRSR